MSRTSYFDREALGARMKLAREAKGLSRKTVAERLGVTPRTICNHEQDNTGPDFDLLGSYRRMYGVTLDWLILAIGPGPIANPAPISAVA